MKPVPKISPQAHLATHAPHKAPLATSAPHKARKAADKVSKVFFWTFFLLKIFFLQKLAPTGIDAEGQGSQSNPNLANSVA